jgi:murein DD-endopeptidase MepM/ murein hydrolase activator NlpD
LAFSSVVFSTVLSRRMVNYSDSLTKNREQQAVISSFLLKTSQVDRAIDELVREDNELRQLLGLKNWQSKVRLTVGTASSEGKVDAISKQLEKINSKIAEKRASFEEMRSWVNTVRSRLASTPSGWPIYGRLASRFGYRVSPWRGMHTGIDIDANYGSPARATAPGIVTFAGWRQGYGKLVEITHGFGLKTLYAHNSSFAVSVGQRVKKGQVVSFVGMTGWTTGPHLHYEVRRWDVPFNPMAFLDTNILSASRIWR